MGLRVNGKSSFLRVAAWLLPEGDRARKVEEWEADLSYCAELAMSTTQVGWGMLGSALRLRSLDFNKAIQEGRKESKMRIALSLVAAGVVVGAGAAFGIGAAVNAHSNNVKVITVDPAMFQPPTPAELHEMEYPSGPFETLGGVPADPILGLPAGDSN